MQVISQDEVDVVLMRDSMTVAAEPVCPAMIEAAAIVEAEWIRLARLGAPARHGVNELPAARRCGRRPFTTVTIERGWPAPLGSSGGQRPHWAAHTVWARERSPPAW